MAFWDIFKEVNTSNNSKLNRLHLILTEKLPGLPEEKYILISCLSGLMARIAYVDFDIDQEEQKLMHEALKEWTDLSPEEVSFVSELAISEIKSLAGLDTSNYCRPLNDILDNAGKYQVLKTLFAIAASHDGVESKEAEEIRVIATGLLLEHKHFIASRATVLEHIGTLNA